GGDGERLDGPDAVVAGEGRPGRDPHVEGRPRLVTRLALARRVVAGAEQDPPVLLARAEGGPRGEGARGARARAEGAEPPVPEARRLGGARGRDPRDGLQEGRGLLH